MIYNPVDYSMKFTTTHCIKENKAISKIINTYIPIDQPILDLGSNIGLGLQLCIRKNYIGIDSNEEMVEYAKYLKIIIYIIENTNTI